MNLMNLILVLPFILLVTLAALLGETWSYRSYFQTRFPRRLCRKYRREGSRHYGWRYESKVSL